MPAATPPPERVAADATAAHAAVRAARSRGARIVFTNGCFDLLHAGHATYLAQARSLGDFLVVGLNDDASVARLKGPHRPLQVLSDRALLLASLRAVDLVVPFAEDTPLALVEALRPDVLVKGGDYHPDTVVGAAETLARGGRVEVLPFLVGRSTSSLEARIKRQAGPR